MRGNIEKYHLKYAKRSDVGPHFGASCVIDSRGGAFFSATYFLEPLGGTPLNRCWHPLVHRWLDFVTFWKDFGSKLAPSFKDSRATNVTNHTFNKIKQGFKDILLIINPNKTLFYFCCFTKPRKSEAQSL